MEAATFPRTLPFMIDGFKLWLILWRDDDFPEDRAVAQHGESVGRTVEGKSLMDDRFDAAFGGPIESEFDIGAVAAIAADQLLLFHKK